MPNFSFDAIADNSIPQFFTDGNPHSKVLLIFFQFINDKLSIGKILPVFKNRIEIFFALDAIVFSQNSTPSTKINSIIPYFPKMPIRVGYFENTAIYREIPKQKSYEIYNILIKFKCRHNKDSTIATGSKSEAGTKVPLLQKSNGFAVAFCMIAIVLKRKRSELCYIVRHRLISAPSVAR